MGRLACPPIPPTDIGAAADRDQGPAGPRQTYQASVSIDGHDLAHADHGAERIFDQLGDPWRDAGEPQIDAELAAVARFAGGVHAAGHRAQLGDGLDQARQQAGIGGGGDEEEGSDGASLRARRGHAGGDSLGWHGRVSLHEIAEIQAAARRPQATGTIIIRWAIRV